MECFKHHRNIAKILGYSENPLCIVMKYYDQGSLTHWIKTARNRSLFQVMRFAHGISSGLYLLHSKGIVHNDLKPDNILIDRDENGNLICVLTDFGICQVLNADILAVKAFKVTEIKGLSKRYVAQERLSYFRGHVAILAKETILSWDTFSLGITLIELLNGQML